jgi:hypothetical protein
MSPTLVTFWSLFPKGKPAGNYLQSGKAESGHGDDSLGRPLAKPQLNRAGYLLHSGSHKILWFTKPPIMKHVNP